jgi:putative ABC transport system permease protein
MKYLPLIWAALWRKPARTILTFLAVTAAFTLFGTMAGFNNSVKYLVETSRRDRVFIYPAFGEKLTVAFRDQLLRLPGVALVGYESGMPGYYRDRSNSLFVNMWEDGWRNASPEYPIGPALWSELQASRPGILVSRQLAARNHLKPGDAFTFITDGVTRQDGAHHWDFTVIGLVDDIPAVPEGYIIGNYAYLDESRPISERGTADYYVLWVTDPARAAATAKAIDALSANSSAPTFSIPDRAQAESNARAGIDVPFVTTLVAGCGLFMVLFLIANGLAQSVRERIPEFAMLKTLGFSDRLVMSLVFAEAAIPCLLGAGLGLGLAEAFAAELPRLIPYDIAINLYLPPPALSAMVLGLALLCALGVALFSTALPDSRLLRLNIAAALSERA